MTVLTALALLSRTESGTFILWVSIAFSGINLNRAFVGEVLLVVVPGVEKSVRDELAQARISASIAVGALLTVLVLLVELAARTFGIHDPGHLAVTTAAVLPILLWHDSARFSLLAVARSRVALLVDVVTLVMLLAIVGTLAASGVRVMGSLLIIAWACAAACGIVTFSLVTRVHPRISACTSWLAQHHRLSGGFVGTALIAQTHAQAMNFFLVGLVSPAALSGVRGTQTLVVQPVQNLGLALVNFLTPRYSTDGSAAAGGPSLTRRRVIGTSGVLAASVFGMSAVPGVLLATYLAAKPGYRDMADFVLPCVLQAGMAFAQMPAIAAIRAMRSTSSTASQAAGYAVLNLLCLVGGIVADGALGAMWGLALGTGLGTALTLAIFLRVMGRTPQPVRATALVE